MQRVDAQAPGHTVFSIGREDEVLLAEGAAGAHLRCLDAAREGARAAARGDGVAAVTAVVDRAAPDGAVTSVATDDEAVRVTVTLQVAPLGPLPLGITVSAEATALREPGSAG